MDMLTEYISKLVALEKLEHARAVAQRHAHVPRPSPAPRVRIGKGSWLLAAVSQDFVSSNAKSGA